jgi:hypothetical protein
LSCDIPRFYHAGQENTSHEKWILWLLLSALHWWQRLFVSVLVVGARRFGVGYFQFLCLASRQVSSNTATRIKDALQVYKRRHQKQMQELPNGSQRRLFHDLWERLRMADIPEDQMPPMEVPVPVPTAVRVAVAADASQPDAVGSHVPVLKSDWVDAALPPVRVDMSRDNTRESATFPVCSDTETQAKLKPC